MLILLLLAGAAALAVWLRHNTRHRQNQRLRDRQRARREERRIERAETLP